MKTILAVLFLVAAASAAPRELCSSESDHDLTDGVCGGSTNVLVYKKDLYVKGSFLQVNVRDVSWPEEGGQEATIKCIKITDQVADGRGGCPTILEGGAGLKHVKLEFISQRGRDMKFHIEIYK